jgi:hypothetical protein
LASVGRLAFCSLCRFCRMREHAPRFLADARRCPPSLVGFLARIWASRFAWGALMKLIAVLEAPWRKTQTLKKPRDRPRFGGSAEGAGACPRTLQNLQQEAPSGGSAEGAGGVFSHSAKPATRSPPPGGSAAGAGGLSSHSARPTTRHPASQKPRTQRQVCPPPERSETQGGRGRTRVRAAGGAGYMVLISGAETTLSTGNRDSLSQHLGLKCLKAGFLDFFDGLARNAH